MLNNLIFHPSYNSDKFLTVKLTNIVFVSFMLYKYFKTWLTKQNIKLKILSGKGKKQKSQTAVIAEQCQILL